MRSRTCHSGFTLIELAVVVGVVIILLGVAVPSLGGMLEERTVYNAAYQLMQRVRTIQELAITHRSGYPDYQLSLDPGSGTYSTITLGKTNVYTMPPAATLSVVGLASMADPVSFDWRGSPCEGASATALTSSLVITISGASGRKQVAVSISPVLGRASIAWTAR